MKLGLQLVAPTVVALRNPVLYPPAFCEVRDLRPVLIWICAGAEGTACAMCCWVLLRLLLHGILWIASEARMASHRRSIIHVDVVNG